jgi:hypothetical protein
VSFLRIYSLSLYVYIYIYPSVAGPQYIRVDRNSGNYRTSTNSQNSVVFRTGRHAWPKLVSARRHGPRQMNALMGYDIAEKRTCSFRQHLVASSYRNCKRALCRVESRPGIMRQPRTKHMLNLSTRKQTHGTVPTKDIYLLCFPH